MKKRAATASRYLKPHQISFLIFLIAPGLGSLARADEFTGDTKLACEALMCLSTPQRPSECSAALSRYFAIKGKQALQGRTDFLKLCPSAESSPEMDSLTAALASGAGGQCDIASLNKMTTWSMNSRGEELAVIGNQMPSYCTGYYANSIIASANSEGTPVYVGTPELSGYWVAQKDYAAALADYNRQLEAWKAQQEAAEKYQSGGN